MTENMGCRLNAYTSREQTVYYANVLKEDVGEALNTLSEMLLNSNFDPKAIEREKRTILQVSELAKRQSASDRRGKRGGGKGSGRGRDYGGREGMRVDADYGGAAIGGRR
jgi:predicted Zn-dependent peptidase